MLLTQRSRSSSSMGRCRDDGFETATHRERKSRATPICSHGCRQEQSDAVAGTRRAAIPGEAGRSASCGRSGGFVAPQEAEIRRRRRMLVESEQAALECRNEGEMVRAGRRTGAESSDASPTNTSAIRRIDSFGCAVLESRGDRMERGTPLSSGCARPAAMLATMTCCPLR